MSRRGHGEGSVFQRKDGRWVGTLNFGWQDGKRRRKYFYGATRREVAEVLTKAQRDAQLGLTVARDERLTVADYLERWLRWDWTRFSIDGAVLDRDGS